MWGHGRDSYTVQLSIHMSIDLSINISTNRESFMCEGKTEIHIDPSIHKQMAIPFFDR